MRFTVSLLLALALAPSSGSAQTYDAEPYSELFVEQLTIMIDLQNDLYELTGGEGHRIGAEQFSYIRDIALNPNDYGPEHHDTARSMSRSWKDSYDRTPEYLRNQAEFVLDMTIRDKERREQREREEEFSYESDVEELDRIIRDIHNEAMNRVTELDREEVAVWEAVVCRGKRIVTLRNLLQDPEKNGRTPESLKSISNMIREQGKAGVLQYIGECNPY